MDGGIVPWPHQERGLKLIDEALGRGVKRILLTCPTGGGKTEIMFLLAKRGRPVTFYLHRRILLEQFAYRLKKARIPYGIRCSGYAEELTEPIQLASIQTEHRRVYGKRDWRLSPSDLVFIDEAHDQKGEMAEQITSDHIELGATIVGFTATPVGCGGMYDTLAVAATNTDLRCCGAILPSTTYAPEEPSAKSLMEPKDGRYSQKAIERACKKGILAGNVYREWKRCNPGALPAVGFASSVGASLYHATEFHKRGIGAAHIDGADTWINGEWYRSDESVRDQLRDEMMAGTIKVVWNRFILREGVDWPFLYHGIFATIFGSLAAYLQAGGRILRNYPDYDHVIFTDHGGNWWRHGSLNADRTWTLDDTASLAASKRTRALREKKIPQPIVCRKCKAVREFGRECPECGFISRTRIRYVRQTNGELSEVEGDIFKPRRRSQQPHHAQAWERVFYRAERAGMTFGQAEALFARENNWFWPSPEFPLMPKLDSDFFRKVADVPDSRLTIGRAALCQQRQLALEAEDELSRIAEAGETPPEDSLFPEDL